jgi:hypothetical protein
MYDLTKSALEEEYHGRIYASSYFFVRSLPLDSQLLPFDKYAPQHLQICDTRPDRVTDPKLNQALRAMAARKEVSQISSSCPRVQCYYMYSVCGRLCAFFVLLVHKYSIVRRDQVINKCVVRGEEVRCGVVNQRRNHELAFCGQYTCQGD